jgi:PAS domain S-box-containing protein
VNDSPSRIRVLHVDADADFLEATAEHVEAESEAIEVVSVRDPDAGLERLAEGDIDCVVSDHDVPGMDGIEFLAAVREAVPGLPFVLFAGKGGEEVAREAISAGVTDYLERQPWRDQYTLLANRIENAVLAARSREASAERKPRLDALVDYLPGLVYRCRVEPGLPMEFVGGEAESLTGYPAEELADGNVSWGEALVVPEDREGLLSTMRAAAEAGEPFEHSYHLRTREGDRRSVWMRGQPTREATDGPAAVEGFVTDVTVHEEHRRELRETTRQLEAVIEASPNAIVVSTIDGTVELWNPAAERIFGWSAEDVEGSQVPIVPPERADEFASHRERMRRGERLTGVETTRVRRDGERIDVSLSAAPVRDDDGNIARSMAVFEDITERKHSERRLREATDRMRLALKGANSWLWTWDLETDAITQSAVTGLLGVEGEEVTRPVDEFVEEIHPGDREAFLAEARAAAAEDRPYRSEFRLQQDDTVSWIDSRGQVYTQSDEPARIVGIATEVTERKERERRLELFRALLDESDESVFVTEAETARIEDVNETACRLLGYDREQLLSMRITDIQLELDGDDEWRDLVATLEDSGGLLFEGHHRRSDGSTYPVEVNASTTVIDGQQYVLGVVRDITHRLEVERELRRQVDRLDEFASIVSHDLRNPLSVLRGRLDLAEETGEPEHFAAARDAIARMTRLIDDLLSLAREGKTVEDLEQAELARLVEDCWGGVATGTGTLVVETDRAPLADPDRLRQLFENLFRNAVEHGATDATVTVGDCPGGFYVADDGAGVAPGDRDRVFEAGYSTGGTGLGLAIVGRIAEAHGWTVRLTESASGGARFEFTGVEFPEDGPGDSTDR